MSEYSLEEFYGRIIGIESPWEVQEIIDNSIKLEVSIIIAYAEGEYAACPKCGKEVKIHDRKPRRWRYLDSCNRKTFIEAAIPRAACDAHGVLQIKVPWAEQKSRFAADMEFKICLWLKKVSISFVATMFSLGWDEVAAIQKRAEKQGLARLE